MKKIGIMSAMVEEIDMLIAELDTDRCTEKGMRQYHEGRLWGVPAVLVFSRWGKVAAATTATQLISEYKVDEIVFTGVAGGICPKLSIGDVVVAKYLYQHDMDARPIFSRHEVPLLNMHRFETDAALSKKAIEAAGKFFTDGFCSKNAVCAKYDIAAPKVVESNIASGDKFIGCLEDKEELRSRLPDVACVEMEGGAVAQVCHEYKVPFTVIRTISDAADEQAHFDFAKFVRDIASRYSHGILRNMYKGI